MVEQGTIFKLRLKTKTPKANGIDIAQWVMIVSNRRIKFIDKNLFPMSSGESERASERENERSGVRERSEQCGASE